MHGTRIKISSACPLFSVNYYMFRPHGLNHEDLISKHCQLLEAVHVPRILNTTAKLYYIRKEAFLKCFEKSRNRCEKCVRSQEDYFGRD
jgi:hypothetical protein